MINVYSSSCLIDEGQTFLLTGGTYSMETVSRYNINGWLEDLDNLNTGRRLHGCTQYTNNDGVKVIMFALKLDNLTFYFRHTSCVEDMMAATSLTAVR